MVAPIRSSLETLPSGGSRNDVHQWHQSNALRWKLDYGCEFIFFYPLLKAQPDMLNRRICTRLHVSPALRQPTSLVLHMKRSMILQKNFSPNICWFVMRQGTNRGQQKPLEKDSPTQVPSTQHISKDILLTLDLVSIVLDNSC